jgi:hypothetical protein
MFFGFPPDARWNPSAPSSNSALAWVNMGCGAHFPARFPNTAPRGPDPGTPPRSLPPSPDPARTHR